MNKVLKGLSILMILVGVFLAIQYAIVSAVEKTLKDTNSSLQYRVLALQDNQEVNEITYRINFDSRGYYYHVEGQFGDHVFYQGEIRPNLFSQRLIGRLEVNSIEDKQLKLDFDVKLLDAAPLAKAWLKGDFQADKVVKTIAANLSGSLQYAKDYPHYEFQDLVLNFDRSVQGGQLVLAGFEQSSSSENIIVKGVELKFELIQLQKIPSWQFGIGHDVIKKAHLQVKDLRQYSASYDAKVEGIVAEFNHDPWILKYQIDKNHGFISETKLGLKGDGIWYSILLEFYDNSYHQPLHKFVRDDVDMTWLKFIKKVEVKCSDDNLNWMYDDQLVADQKEKLEFLMEYDDQKDHLDVRLGAQIDVINDLIKELPADKRHKYAKAQSELISNYVENILGYLSGYFKIDKQELMRNMPQNNFELIKGTSLEYTWSINNYSQGLHSYNMRFTSNHDYGVGQFSNEVMMHMDESKFNVNWLIDFDIMDVKGYQDLNKIMPIKPINKMVTSGLINHIKPEMISLFDDFEPKQSQHINFQINMNYDSGLNKADFEYVWLENNDDWHGVDLQLSTDDFLNYELDMRFHGQYTLDDLLGLKSPITPKKMMEISPDYKKFAEKVWRDRDGHDVSGHFNILTKQIDLEGHTLRLR